MSVAGTRPGRARVRWAVAVLAVAAVVAVAVIAVVSLTGGDDPGEVYRIVVPLGTWDAIEAGERIELIPRRLELLTGDTLIVVNEDDRVHQVGPYVIAPGDTLVQEYPDPGIIAQGLCTLHPDGRVEIVITERG